MSIVIEKAFKHVVPVIEGLGYEVVDIEYEKKYGQMNLTFFIYSENGISFDDCEKVHTTIDPVLDEVNPTKDEPYVLNVSSPGLDRPFKTQRDFERNYNKEVEIKLYAPLKGKKIYEGKLVARDENSITISIKDDELKIENNKVAYVRPLVKFE